MKKLLLHSSSNTDSWVQVDTEVKNGKFHLFYEIQLDAKDHKVLSGHYQSKANRNWGLWNENVVEVFLQKKSQMSEPNFEYLEFNFSLESDYNFFLQITRPRVCFYSPLNLEFQVKKKLLRGRYFIEFQIDVDKIPGDGDKIFGGIFSCLGPENNRSYLALNPNPEEKPDFHRPELFLDLMNI